MTDIQKRLLSDAELAKISVRSQERFSSEYFTARDAHRDRCALLSHIAALTAPPSQGKVERAREIAHNIVSYCREHRSNTDVPTYTREEAEEYVTSAITQALTESSGQGTDGAEHGSGHHPDRKLGERDALKFTVTWLHERASGMNDPHAKAVLNSAAFDLGIEIRDQKRALKSKQPSDTGGEK